MDINEAIRVFENILACNREQCIKQNCPPKRSCKTCEFRGSAIQTLEAAHVAIPILRAAAKEHAGLTPEAVAQLKQIAEIFNCDPADPAQLKDLCVKLQGLAQFERAKQLVGSTVFRVLTPTLRIIEHEIRSIGEAVDVTRLLGDHSRIVQVYLTRQEAEAAVERLKGEDSRE